MPRHPVTGPYTPPEYNAENWPPLPLAQLGDAALAPHTRITGIGGFSDFNPVQRAAMREVVIAGSEFDLKNAPRAVVDYNLQHAMGALAPADLSRVVHPKKSFMGRIAGGHAYVLPFDAKRLGPYRSELGSDTIAAGLSVVFVGSLSTRGVVYEGTEFMQEVVFAVDRAGKPIRVLGPNDSLQTAAAAATSAGRSAIRAEPSAPRLRRGVQPDDSLIIPPVKHWPKL